MRFLISLFLLLLSLATAQAAPLPVSASFSILGDLVQNIGGERIQLTTLVGPDQDAHVYQPSPSDIQKLGKTRLFFVNGLGFEGWQQRMQQASSYPGKVIVVTEGIAPLKLNGSAQANDPHAWQDPVCAKQMVANIAAALSNTDPEGRSYYQQRATAYNQQLDTLLSWAQKQVATIPANKRIILTSHDAFGYLGKRLGIQLRAVQGMSTESEASAKEIATLIQLIRQSGIRAVFMENISNPKMIEQIAHETNTQLGGKLYSDALSQQAPANSYLAMYRYNVSTLIAGMQNNR